MDCRRLKRLNKYYYVLFFIMLCPIVIADELQHAKVIGTSVNVRAKPHINSEIVTQLSKYEAVEILESDGEWTKIKTPPHAKCWVINECISTGMINKDSVNLRCGPGIAFPVMAELKKGTRVDVIEIFGEWTRIKPPVEFGVWVNSKYLEYEKLKGEKSVVEIPVKEEKPKEVSVPEKEITGVELVSYAGKLEDLGIIINRPGAYKLISENNKWLCIVKSTTLDLNPYINRVVRIEGVLLAKKSSWDVPVIEAKRLRVIK